MLTITRSLARHLRAAFRRAGIKLRGGSAPPILFHGSADGLSIQAISPEIALEYHRPDAAPCEEIAVPSTLLDDCQGKAEEPVTIEARPKNKVVATWQDRGIPQQAEYDAQPIREAFPAAPESFEVVEQSFWQALREAAECTDRESSRYALQNILLKGDGGSVTASDGRQLYRHGGFQFPWSGDAMIPASGVLGCTELAGLGPIEIGKTDKSIALRIGRWTLVIAIDSSGRFPKLDDIFADADSGSTTLVIPPTDAQFLAQALPRLPQSDEFPELCTTLDLGGEVCLRALGVSEGAPATELILSGARVVGEPLRLALNRRYLERALKLGLTELRLKSPERAILAFDGRRKYIWMPLDPQGALGPSEGAIRIVSPSAVSGNGACVPRQQTERETVMNPSPPTANSSLPLAAPSPAEPPATAPAAYAEPVAVARSAETAAATVKPAASSNGNRRSRKTTKGGSAGPIEQAIAVRDHLRESVTKANELIRTLKRQRQHSRLVQTTLASLKQLQQAG